MGIIKLILTYIMCHSQILAPLQITLTPGGEASYFTQWSVNDTFDAADYIELEKQEGEDFVILNLADIQLSDAKAYGELGECSEDLITKLIADNDPDLITLSGDNAWDTAAYMRLIEFLDGFGIPWHRLWVTTMVRAVSANSGLHIISFRQKTVFSSLVPRIWVMVTTLSTLQRMANLFIPCL